MLDFPDNPAVDEVFQDWRWDGIRWVSEPTPVVTVADPQCGRLVYVNGGNLSLIPFKGDEVKIAGELAQIPAGGVPLSYSGLTPGTLYFVYYDGTGLIASTDNHVPDDRPGNDGIHIREGYPGQSLVGMAVVDSASGLFRDTPALRLVASWFNPRPRSVMQMLGGPFQPGSSFVQYGPNTEFLSWKNVPFSIGFFGTGTYTGTFNMGVRIQGNARGYDTIIWQTQVMNGQNVSFVQSVAPILGGRDLDDGRNIWRMMANCAMGTRSLDNTAFNGMTVI